MKATTIDPVIDNTLIADLKEVRIDLEVTSVCDAVCGFCPRDVMPDKKTYVSMDVVNRLAEEVRRTPVTAVILCGIGESTLHPKLGEIVRTLTDAGARVEMTTHGGRMTVGKFQELVALGLTSVNFSMNAATADTHRAVMKLKDYDKTITNLQGILELRRHSPVHAQIPIHVTFVVCELNQHEVPAFVDFWRPTGVSSIWLHPVNNRAGLVPSDIKSTGNLDAFKKMFDGDPLVWVDVFKTFPEEYGICKIAHKMIFISAEGEMRLCAMDYQRTTSYGNVKTHGLQGMHADKLSRYLRGELDAYCTGCDFCPSGGREERAKVLELRHV